MYLEYILENEEVKRELNETDPVAVKEFRKSFSTNNIYKLVQENIEQLISPNDIELTFNNIKEFSKNYVVNYLITKSRELS
jgi:hypothetical protein